MLKKIAHRPALILALTLLITPVIQMHAQSATTSSSIVTGGDPQPTGEPPPPPQPKSASVTSTLALAALIALGLA